MDKVLAVVNEDQSIQELWHPVSSKEKRFDERWLQDLLIANPGLLPVRDIDENIGRLIPIGREVPMASGSIDNLYVTKGGIICLVETKLWRNPEAHRTVVAQIIAYAKDLARMTFKEFAIAIEKSQILGKKIDFWSRITISGGKEERIALESRIQLSINRGRFLLLVVGDRIYPEVAMIVETIHSAPSLEFRIGLVEMELFQPGQDRSWPLLLVPHLVAKSYEVTRAVVKIFYEEKKPEVEVAAIDRPQDRGSMDRDTFEKAMPKDFAEVLMPQIDLWIDGGNTIFWGMAGLSIGLRWQGKSRSFIDIYPDSFALYSERMLKKRGFPLEPYRRYFEKVSKVPKARDILSQGKRYLYYRDISADEFRLILDATDLLLKDIQQANK